MLLWHHGTKEKNWKDSGWVLDRVFYPVEFDKSKELGLELLKKDIELHPEKYRKEVGGLLSAD